MGFMPLPPTKRCPGTRTRPLCRNVSEIFVVSMLEDFAGDFPGGFFWALFLTEMRRKYAARKKKEKPAAKQKIAKIRSAKNRPRKMKHIVRCCFAPPSGRNRQGHFQSILVNFSRLCPHSQSISVDFSLIFSHFWSVPSDFNQF